MEKRILPGMLVAEIERHARNDHFITACPLSGEGPEGFFARIARFKEKYSLSIVSMEVYGIARSEGLTQSLEPIACPISWIDAAGESGMQAWAVSNTPVKPVEWEGRIVGSAMEEESARYLKLIKLDEEDLGRILASREMEEAHVVQKSIGGGVLAVKGLDENTAVLDAPPPVENPPEVRELVLPDFRYLFIRGSTVDAVDGALKFRGVDWGNVTRVVALNQKDEDMQMLDALLDDPDTALLPLLQVHIDAGRERPLFEVDAGVII